MTYLDQPKWLGVFSILWWCSIIIQALTRLNITKKPINCPLHRYPTLVWRRVWITIPVSLSCRVAARRSASPCRPPTSTSSRSGSDTSRKCWTLKATSCPVRKHTHARYCPLKRDIISHPPTRAWTRPSKTRIWNDGVKIMNHQQYLT